MLGADLSVPLGKFVLRAEVAEYLGEAQEPAVNAGVIMANSERAWREDWYPGNDWNVGVQYSHKYIEGCKPRLQLTAIRMATLRLSKDLLTIR